MPLAAIIEPLVALTIIATGGSTKCVQVNYEFCPTYPVAGVAVADEFKNATAEEYPATWEWIGGIDKLRQELELCKNS